MVTKFKQRLLRSRILKVVNEQKSSVALVPRMLEIACFEHGRGHAEDKAVRIALSKYGF